MNRDNGYNAYPDEVPSYDDKQKESTASEDNGVYPDDDFVDTQEDNSFLHQENKVLQKQNDRLNASLKRLQKKIRKLQRDIGGTEKKHRHEPDEQPSTDSADEIVAALPLNEGQLQKSDCKQILFYKDNEHVYVAGKKLVTKDGFRDCNCDFDQALSEFSLDIDEHMAEEEAATHWFDLMEIYPQVTDILVANSIVGLSRSLFIEAQTPPQYMVYMVSPSHKGKTTYCCMTSSIFNRASDVGNSITSASSSPSSMQKAIWRFRDCPVIIDDLYCGNNISSMTGRESAVSKIIRICGNNEENKKQLGKTTVGFAPNSTVVMTAEYLLHDFYSSLSRCVILHLEHGLEKSKVSPLQKNPLALSTAAYFFIKWCAKNYSDNVRLIREEHSKFLERCQCEPFGLERIKASAFVLETGIRLLCNYVMEIGILSEKGVINTMHSINVSLSHIIAQQITDMEDTGAVEHCQDLTYPIGYLLKQNRLKIAPSVKDYQKDNHDGVLQENLICLDSKKLVCALKDCLHDLKINQEEIGHDLRGHCLLVMDKSDSSTKKTKNVRMFHIRKHELYNFLSLDNILN